MEMLLSSDVNKVALELRLRNYQVLSLEAFICCVSLRSFKNTLLCYTTLFFLHSADLLCLNNDKESPITLFNSVRLTNDERSMHLY